MQLWVGLGNPGAQYAMHRHNVGFMAVDAIAEVHGFDPPKKGDPELAEAIKELSRLKFGRDRAIVEAEILERSQLSGGGGPQPPAVGEK